MSSYLEIDRHMSVSDILEGFGTAGHLLPAYSTHRRIQSRKAEVRYYRTVPLVSTEVDTSAHIITLITEGIADD